MSKARFINQKNFLKIVTLKSLVQVKIHKKNNNNNNNNNPETQQSDESEKESDQIGEATCP